jgi:thiosulfate/3-mercaptopyruvate sulfurtransferase
MHSVQNLRVSRRTPLAPAKKCFQIVFLLSAFAVLLAASATLLSVPAIRGDEKKPADPWGSAQMVQAADLARELGDKSGTPPAVVYVGFHTLFAGGHIPGATFHGSASTEQGLADLKKWADALPRTTNLVIYCGCCPFEKCPNIRPAFTALSSMGFKKLRVLVLPTSFAADWVDKGYPIQKGM